MSYFKLRPIPDQVGKILRLPVAANVATPLLRVVNPTRWEGRAIPERNWIVPDWLPYGHVTLFYGEGGTGKSLLCQQLMTACATGTQWCGLDVARCRVFGLFCEDDEDELHRRQADINRALDLKFSDLRDIRCKSGVGEDNILAWFERGLLARGKKAKPLFEQIKQTVTDFGAQLIVIDTAADVFGGEENDRSQVRQFIGELNGLAQATGGAVLLTAHPSRSGMGQGGDQDGASTGWNASARSRWALTRPPANDGITPDPNSRILSRRKANYAVKDDSINLRWSAGAMLVEGQVDLSGLLSGAAKTHDQTIQDEFLELFDAHVAAQPGAFLSPAKNATFPAAKILANRSGAKFNRLQWDRAMHQLLGLGVLVVTTVGRKRDGKQHLVRKPLPAEVVECQQGAEDIVEVATPDVMEAAAAVGVAPEATEGDSKPAPDEIG